MEISFRLLALMFVLAQMSQAQEASAYRFELDGEPHRIAVPTLDGDDETPEAGDLFHAERIEMVLGEPGFYQLVGEDRKNSREFLIWRILGDEKKLVGIRLDEISSKDPSPEPSILTTMTDAELKLIRGLVIERWNAEVITILPRLDLAKVVIELTNQSLENGGISDLPQSTEYLYLSAYSNRWDWDYQNLARFKKLRYLKIQTQDMSFDAQSIAENAELVSLDCGIVSLLNPQAIGRLGKLQKLNLAWSYKLKDVSSFGSLSDLRYLDIRNTLVDDLRHFGTLEKLRYLDAGISEVRHLPAEAMPSLEMLKIMGTPLAESDVAEFARLNPHVEVEFDWMEKLRSSLTDVTRIRVRTGSPRFRDPENEKLVFETADTTIISKFIDSIELKEDAAAGHWMSGGHPTIEFYRGEIMVVQLGVYFRKALRWDGWPTDVAITEASSLALASFLPNGEWPPRDSPPP